MTEPFIQLKNVRKEYPNGIVALDGIDLDIFTNEILVILGPSGAGKSTALKCMNALEVPSSGSVLVNSQPIDRQPLRDVRKQVGMIFQQFHLVPRLSVMANVLCGRLAYRNWLTSALFAFPKTDFELAEKALGEVGLSDRAWETASHLSGGQQQRVAIARAIVQNCRVLLADEPVASLDPRTGNEVIDLLVRIAKEGNMGLVINLHQVDLAKRVANRIVGIRKGKAIFDLPTGQVCDEQIQELYQP